uniref:hypothetical protein n=1 Tax=Streptosporangium sp. CA-235898 TaxID=3240073 RepID=UPI003F496FA6
MAAIKNPGDRLIHPAFPGSYVELIEGDGTTGDDLWRVVGFDLPEPDIYTQPQFQMRLTAKGYAWGELVPAT